jgi:hypothetical protein
MALQPQPAFGGIHAVRQTDPDAKTIVRARLAAKRRRTRRIRQIVASFSVAVFIALFATIYVQLASGHDPALSATRTTQSATPTTQSAAPTTQAATPVAGRSSGSDSSSSAATTSSSAGTSSGSSAAPATVTTSQS